MAARNKSRIGILGGTFNPIHTGHLIMAQCALEIFELSKVLFVPCATPPHKTAARLVSVKHRLAMIDAAIENDLRFELCDIEVVRGGTSYSVETVTQLAGLYSDSDLYFIIGSDTLLELHSWRNIGKLLKLCTFVTLVRPGFNTDTVSRAELHLDSDAARKLMDKVSVCHMVDISSSDIRHRIAEGMSIRYLVPRAVELYIAEHCLYGCER